LDWAVSQGIAPADIRRLPPRCQGFRNTRSAPWRM